jgi:hypothetical protein
MRIRQVAAELLHADRQRDGRTDMKKLIAVFRNFENTPTNVLLQNYSVAVQCGSYKYCIPNFRPLTVSVEEGIIERKRA